MTGAKSRAILLSCTVESLFLTMIALYFNVKILKESTMKLQWLTSLTVYMWMFLVFESKGKIKCVGRLLQTLFPLTSAGEDHTHTHCSRVLLKVT